MTPEAPVVDANYREYADLLLQRHQLLEVGNEAEAEIIEDRLSELWEALDDARRQSLNGMASDLNWISRGGTPAPKALNKHDVTAAMKLELDNAFGRGDCHAILHHLRVVTAALRVEDIARSRFDCYQQIGLASLAHEFDNFHRGLVSSGAPVAVETLNSPVSIS